MNAFTIWHAHDPLPTLVCRYCANDFIAKHTNVEPIAVTQCLTGTGYEFGLWDVSPTETAQSEICQFCECEVGK